MIVNIPKKGRCVFAEKDYKKDDTIEICEYIVVPQDQIAVLKKTVLNDYRFWKNGEEWDAMILLWNGSLYNHSITPNMEALQDDDERMWFVALRDIEKWEELTFNYWYKMNCPYIWDAKIVGRVKK